MGIKGKDGFDGSMVADAWRNGEHGKIAEYCQDDVMRVREIHKRFMAVDW
jgi:predicted PolB exonuclease-like 3'-5' exonuclease